MQTLDRADAQVIYSNGATIFVRGIEGNALIVTSKLPGGAQGMGVQYTLKTLDDSLLPVAEKPQAMVMNNGY